MDLGPGISNENPGYRTDENLSDTKPDNPEQMLREYSRSGMMNPDVSLGSRRSVDEFIKSQLYGDDNPKETMTTRGAIGSRIYPHEKLQSLRMSTEYIRPQLNSNNNSKPRLSLSERSDLKGTTVKDSLSKIHSDKNLGSEWMTSEYIKSQLHQNESFGSRRKVEEYIKSRLSSDNYPYMIEGTKPMENSRVGWLTNEYIRSQLSPGQAIRSRYPAREYSGPRNNSPSNLESKVMPDDSLVLERMSSEYIRSQLYSDETSRSDPALLSRMLTAPVSRVDSTPTTYQQSGSPRLEPKHEFDPSISRVDLDQRYGIDPREGKSSVTQTRTKEDGHITGQYGIRRRFDSRIISTVEPCHEEAEIYHVG